MAARVAGARGGAATGLGLAMAGGQALSLVFTIVLTHLLGAADYSSLAAVIAAWLVLVIPGTALQAAAARDIASADDIALPATVRNLERQAALVTLVLVVLGVLLRVPVASLIGVEDSPWAAAAVLPAGGLWLFLSIQRGVLQGVGAYRVVGVSVIIEAGARVVLAVIPAAADAGVSAVWLGAVLALALTSAVIAPTVRRRAHSARATRDGAGHDLVWLARRAWVPAVALSLFALLQNVDVIVVKHVASSHRAGSYAAASLAAKAIVWLAVGLGLYLLPETARRRAAGERARGLLIECSGLLLVAAVPIVVVFAVGAHPILTTVFGHEYGSASGVLALLAIAMTLLSLTYLGVQYLLGLERVRFIAVLAVAAVAEPAVLAGFANLEHLAAALAAVQLALLLAMAALSLRVAQAARSEQIS